MANGKRKSTSKSIELNNHFGRKLALGIIGLLLSPLFGVFAVIFSCLQNSAWNENHMDAFRRWRRLSVIFLILEYATGLLLTAIVGFVLIYAARSKALYRQIEKEVLADNGTITSIVEESTEVYQGDKSNSFSWNGLEISLPVDLAELCSSREMEFSTDPSAVSISAGGDSVIWVDEDHSCSFDIYNTGQETETADQGILGAAAVYPQKAADFSWNGTITGDTTEEELVAAMDCDYSSYTGTDGKTYYKWILPDGWVQFCYEDGLMYRFDLSCTENIFQ